MLCFRFSACSGFGNSFFGVDSILKEAIEIVFGGSSDDPFDVVLAGLDRFSEELFGGASDGGRAEGARRGLLEPLRERLRDRLLERLCRANLVRLRDRLLEPPRDRLLVRAFIGLLERLRGRPCDRFLSRLLSRPRGRFVRLLE